MAMDFNVKAIEPVRMTGPAGIASRDLMSPYVWLAADGTFRMMVRAVPKAGETGDTGTIWYATSPDGVAFTATDAPVIAPGPGPEDAGGCEDPTVVELPDGRFCVYYTGVDAPHEHGEMCYAEGPSPDALVKKGVAMASTPTEGNVKEATVDRTAAGRWRMFYEYAANGASLIGLAVGETVAGPWDHQCQPFGTREEAWDNWHLSTGPLLTTDKDCPVMFYNGATQDARWRIGWVAFDAEYSKVVDRCVEAMIVPPPAKDRDATDIAFAASVVVKDEQIWLYYSRADAILYRALIRRS
jgi:predicted GH43/DUF377 family glycosyl hydrolase